MRQTERFRARIHPIEPPCFLTAPEAAELLRVALVTLNRWRLEGCGPPFRRFGRRIVYARSDLMTWADGQIRSSTSAPPPNAPR
jgi:Helix-turn-helix domain